MSIHDRPSGLPNQFWGALLVFATVLVVFGASIWFAQVEELSFQPTATATPLVIGGIVISPTPDLSSEAIGESSITISSPTPTPSATPTPESQITPTQEDTTFQVPTITPQPRPTLSIEEISEGRERPACGDPPSGWVAYIVQTGDTVFGLSIRTKATISQIVEVNCIENSILYRGTQIFLPTTPPPPPAACLPPPAGWLPYTVQRGNTMYSMALLTGTTIFDITRYNCLGSTSLVAGSVILLPGGGPAPPTATAPPPPPPTSPPPQPTSPPAPTATATPIPPTATATPIPPTATATLPPPTATATPTQAPPTATPTMTATAGPTNTHTPTSAPTATFTPTPLPTNTFTPTPVATATSTPTSTATPTATPTFIPIP